MVDSSRLLRIRCAGPPPRERPVPRLTLLWVAVLLAACGPHRPGPPNVLLITVDTLRADQLGCYGAAATTPHVDRLAREGTLFLNAASPMPSTRPAHFSLLTSLYPRQHGVLSNADSLAEEVVTLPQLFAAAGYRTAAFTGVKLLAPGSGAERGFATFESTQKGHRIAEEVVPQARGWLRSHSGSGSFFLWLHLFDPHMPYAPPDGARVPRPAELPATVSEFSRPQIRSLLEDSGGDLPLWLLEYALELYRGEVEYVDRQLGDLLATLDELSLTTDTLVVFTADHGECFGNGYYFEHGRCLYDGAVRVPLILRYPPAIDAGVEVNRQVELLDVAPTVLALAGLPVPPPFAGRSLLAAAGRRPAFLQPPVYSDKASRARAERLTYLRSVAGDPLRDTAAGDRLALRTEAWKYILGSSGGELYDLENDPREITDLAGERPDVVRRFRALIARWLEEHPPAPRGDDEPDEELKRTLRALGYL